MNPRFLPLLALLLAPLLARAGTRPDFESDAKPILARQPGLIDYIHRHFEVKETGIARVPGDGSAAPQPPFIFNARPRGQSGPFYLALLIQPGPPGRIMKVADVRQLPLGALPPQERQAVATAHPTIPAPASAAAPETPAAAASTPQPAAGAPVQAPAEGIGSDTPSGPVRE